MYTLPPRTDYVGAIRNGTSFEVIAAQVNAWLLGKGFVFGPLPTSVSADGSVHVDTTTDPTAAWEQGEADAAAFRALVRNYLTTLADNETTLLDGIAALNGPTPPNTIAALRNYVIAIAEISLEHNRGLDRLIRVLIDRGIIEDA